MTSKPPFLSIKDAATVTGLSQKYIRTGVRLGEIPHICAGKKYMVNVPALIEQLNSQSMKGAQKS